MNYVFILEAAENVLGVTADHLAKIAEACTVQLNRDLGPFWGGGAKLARVGKDASDVQPDEVVVKFVDQLPDAPPGAVADHAVDGSDAPCVYVAISMCSSILEGPNSVAQATSHELCEAEADPDVNRWADDGHGSEYALEACDAVESASYDHNGVALSDFVLPSFFDPGSKGPRFSFLGTATAPFRTAPGGYQVRRTSGAGTEQQVMGDQRLMAARRGHWTSRAYRRGIRTTTPAGASPPAAMPAPSPQGVAGGPSVPPTTVGGQP